MLAKFSLFSPLLYIPTVLAAAGTLQQVTGNFGSNPTNVGFYIYVPSKLQPKPPIVVNPHWCQGSAQAAFAGSQTASLADTYGYIVIYPDSPHTDGKCWDVSSTQTLTHNGGGDSLGIVSMVKYTLAKYNGDASRVFAWGVSSGAMMTNVLLGSYPDVFAAGSAWAGVAFGCFAGNGYDVWNDDCAKGRTIKTGAEWKAIVTDAYPGYSGFRPKLQVFHGSTDTVLYPQNLQEEIKEWTAVLGLPSSPVSTLSNSPSNGWTTSVYGDKFQATLASGVSHDIQPIFSVILAWFDLNCTTGCYSHGSGGSTGGGPGGDPGTSTVRPTTSTSTKAPPTTTITSGQGTWPQMTPGVTGENLVSQYGQCGGDGYTGWTVCNPRFTCKFFNQWYSQCL